MDPNDNEFECIDADIGELLPLFEEDLLGPQERQLFESHLRACHRCEGDQRVLRQVAQAIRKLPAGLGEAEPERQSARGKGLRVWGAPVAALVVALGAGYWWQARQNEVLTAQVRLLDGRLTRIETENSAIRQALAGQRAEGTALAHGEHYVAPR